MAAKRPSKSSGKKKPSSGKKKPPSGQSPGSSPDPLAALQDLLAGELLDKLPSNPLVSLLKELGLDALKALLQELGAQALRMLLLSLVCKAEFEKPSELETHFGPAGHKARHGTPGQTLFFTVRVFVAFNLYSVLRTPEVRRYVKEVLDIPASGGVPGLPVEWGDLTQLKEHGTLGFTPKDEKTDKNGKVMLQFTPKREKRPGVGPEQSRSVELRPSVLCHPIPIATLGVLKLEVPPLTVKVHFHPSYRVQQERGPFKLQGQKLGGALGNWELLLSGRLSGAGLAANLSGRFAFELDESLGGEVDFEVKLEPEQLPAFLTIGLSFTGKGMVQLEPSSGEASQTQLWMAISQIHLDAQGEGHSNPWGSVQAAFSEGGTGAMSLPVEILLG